MSLYAYECYEKDFVLLLWPIWANGQIITTYAGGGTAGLGDSGLATSAQIGNFGGIAIDEHNNVYYIADRLSHTRNDARRKVQQNFNNATHNKSLP
jgi:hypothetical protein